MQVSGLTAATGYYYRALCGGQATGSFQTAPGGGGSNTLFVAVPPPASWPSVTNAVAEFGPTSGLGGFTLAQSLSPGRSALCPGTPRRGSFLSVGVPQRGHPTRAPT